MDAQQRLTKIEEWKPGRRYQWKKGDERGPIALCLGIVDNSVRLKEVATGIVVTYSPQHWLMRWTELIE